MRGLLTMAQVRRKQLGLHVARSLVSSIVARTLRRVGQGDRRRRVSIRDGRRVLLTGVSTGLVIRMVVGVISGTVGCAPGGSRVIVQARGQKGRTVMSVSSSKGKVTSRVGPQVFSVFCDNTGRVTSDHQDLKLKLSLYGSVVGTRNKRLAISSGLPRKAMFAFALPTKRIGMCRWIAGVDYEE